MQGATQGAHLIRVALNDAEIGAFEFNAQENHVATLSFNSALLREGDNTVKITSGNSSDISVVDYVRLNYARRYLARGGSLSFTVPAGRAVRISGFSDADSVRALDITDPNNPQQLTVTVTADRDGYGFSLPPSATPRIVRAFDRTSPLAQALSVTRNALSNWHDYGKGAQLVIVAPAQFRAAAENVAALRRQEGLQVVVVDIEDVYDEFNFGVAGSQALKDFFAYAQTWSMPPRYALLFGDTTLDPRDYLGLGARNFVPTRHIDTALLETVSDDWLADFDNDGVPDMAIGRLPVRTAAQADAIAAKLTRYATENFSAAQGMLLVSDSDFAAASAQLKNVLPAEQNTYSIERGSQPDANVRENILTQINNGYRIVNYTGHGSVAVWTGAGLLRSDDAPQLTNGDHLSFFNMLTCLNGYPDLVTENLAKSLLLAENGGAVGVWASSGLTESEPQVDMTSAMYKNLFVTPGGNKVRVGDAILAAKRNELDSDVRQTWILYGDPTMRLQTIMRRAKQ